MSVTSSSAAATSARQGVGRNIRRLVLNTRAIGFLLIAVLMVIWEILVVTKVVDLISFPRMSATVVTFVTLVVGGEVLGEVAASLVRMFIGYGLAIIAGIVIGLLMGYSRFLYDLFEPITEFLRPIPSPAYIPIVILFLGIGDNMKIFTVFLAAFFPILLNSYSGVRSVDKVQIDTARTFGLTSGQIVREIVVPASSPYIFTGMRISLSVALILVVISEMVASNNGIGFFVLNMQRSFRIKEMYAGVIMLAILGYLLNRAFLFIERALIGWSYAQNRGEERVSEN